MSETTVSIAAPKQLFGIILYVLAIFLLAAMDASAKWVVNRYPISEIAFLRALFSIVPILAAGAAEQQSLNLSSRMWPLLLLRGALVLGTIVSFFFSIQGLPLATATAISMTSPILMVVCSAIFLTEQVSLGCWAFVFIGFIGALLTIGSLSATASIFTAAALLSALLYAVSALLTKRLARTEPAFRIAAYTNMSMLVVSLGGYTDDWIFPKPDDVLVFILLGVLGGFGNYIYTAALRRVDISATALIEYTILVWSALFGLSLFGEIPTVLTVTGAVLIVASGVANARLQRQSE